MNWVDPWLLLVPVGGFVVLLGLWRLMGMGHEVQAARARELFRLQQEHLSTLFLQAALDTNKPRGLLYLSCDFCGELTLARDRAHGNLVGLIPVTVRFQAVEGSDMEDLPAVDLPRHATAVFSFQRGEWSTSGRVVFNLTPDETIHNFASEFTMLQPQNKPAEQEE